MPHSSTNHKIRIAVLTTVHDPNDTRIYHRQIPSLIKAGFEVVYLCKAQPKLKRDVEVVLLHEFSNKYFRLLFAPLFAFWKALFLKDIAIYHFHDPELIIAGLLLKLFGKKVIYDVHEDYPKYVLSSDWIPSFLQRFLSFWISKLERFSALFFDKIITVIEQIAQRFPASKTVLVQNFPGMHELDYPNSTPYQNRANNIIYVGEITSNRGIIEVVEALEFLPDSNRLILIGRISDPMIREEIKNYKGWEKVDFLGVRSREEVAYYLSQSRVGIVCIHPAPNFIEALPTKLLEYMSAGIPVVASNFEKLKAIVDVYDTGITVDPLSVQELKEAILYLIEHPQEAEQKGENGKRAIEQHYSWENEEKNLIKAYQSLLQ